VKPAPVMTMQKIFVEEKGDEHLRTQNINYLHTLRNDEPNMEIRETRRKRGASSAVAPVSEEVKTSSVTLIETPVWTPAIPTVKKSLKLSKSEDGKKKEVKVTTTIVKAKHSKPLSKRPVPTKKVSAKKLAPKRKVIKVKATAVTKKTVEIKTLSTKKETVNAPKPSATPKKHEPEVKKRDFKAQEKRGKKDAKNGVSKIMRKPVGNLTVAEVKKLLQLI
jgi:hypothetical protein